MRIISSGNLLVAAMKIHGINYILTFNTTDFARYAPEGIMAITP